MKDHLVGAPSIVMISQLRSGRIFSTRSLGISTVTKGVLWLQMSLVTPNSQPVVARLRSSHVNDSQF